jgi:PERQ amino acid-rich with GYF domain-containing protein
VISCTKEKMLIFVIDEDMTAMLLSFPPDDPSTAEIISDLVYANSTTLDGRRFAAEFVSKRAADASARAKGVTKPMTATSIADVVRTQPKPAQQNEWGGFKVVNKKKKGGRS